MDGGESRRHEPRAQTSPRQGAPESRPEGRVTHEAASPADGHRARERKGSGNPGCQTGKVLLRPPDDPSRCRMASPSPPEHAGGEGGDPDYCVRGAREAPGIGQVPPLRREPEPLAADPEGRALVTEKGAEAPRAPPLETEAAPDDDRPRAG